MTHFTGTKNPIDFPVPGKHQLHEELNACNPKWQSAYASVKDAATACNCLDLYNDWLHTPEGIAYLQRIAGVPDYREQARREAEAISRLPFNYGNLGAAYRAGASGKTEPDYDD